MRKIHEHYRVTVVLTACGLCHMTASDKAEGNVASPSLYACHPHPAHVVRLARPPDWPIDSICFRIRRDRSEAGKRGLGQRGGQPGRESPKAATFAHYC